MKTCSTCKYWGGSAKERVHDLEGHERFNTCRAVIHDKRRAIDGNGDDTTIEDSHYSDEVKRELIAIRDNAKAAVIDCSGWFAALRCREDFGCVLHERKTNL